MLAFSSLLDLEMDNSSEATEMPQIFYYLRAN
jgi:hypothetical protein